MQCVLYTGVIGELSWHWDVRFPRHLLATPKPHAAACAGLVPNSGGNGSNGLHLGTFPGHPMLGGFGGTPLNGGMGLPMHPQSPGFMKMQSPELDAGSCWFDQDMAPSLGVADIFDDPGRF